MCWAGRCIPTLVAGALACFALRIAALRYGWHLPRALQGREAGRD